MTDRTEMRAELEVSSPAFRAGEAIPKRFTCDGDDVSPPLRLASVPPAAKALAIIMDDLDAPSGPFVHWVVWDLPPATRELEAGADVARLGAGEGANGFGRTGYGGPCPRGGRHRYVFRVYALDAQVALRAGADRAALDAAMAGKRLAEGSLMATYER